MAHIGGIATHGLLLALALTACPGAPPGGTQQDVASDGARDVTDGATVEVDAALEDPGQDVCCDSDGTDAPTDVLAELDGVSEADSTMEPDTPAETDGAEPDTFEVDTSEGDLDDDGASLDTIPQDAADGGDATTGDAVTCSVDADCTGSKPCVISTCDLDAGVCMNQPATDGTACDNPDPTCFDAASCQSGLCVTTKKPAECGTKVCGLDACNNSCGICPIGDICDLPTGECTDPAAACIGIDFLGCCTGDGTTIKYCVNGLLAVLTCDQAQCGYSSDAAWFECTDNPEPTPPDSDFLCPGETCAGSCDGLECGTICGESCGDCPADSYCTEAQACKACGCDPAFECGADPCGNPCGTCSTGLACVDHTCVDPNPDPSPDAGPSDAEDALTSEVN